MWLRNITRSASRRRPAGRGGIARLAARRHCRWAASGRLPWPESVIGCLGGSPSSYYAVWNIIDRSGLSFKKSLHASEPNRPNVARRREQWKKHQGKIDPTRLIFIDETWAKTNRTPIRGRCGVGERLVAKVPHGHWKTLTFVAALRCDGVGAPCLFNKPINARSFLAYIETFPGPPCDPQDRRQALLLAALQPRPQSDRAGIRQAQDPAAKGKCPHRQGRRGGHRRTARQLHQGGMRQRPRQFRICINLRQPCSKPVMSVSWIEPSC